MTVVNETSNMERLLRKNGGLEVDIQQGQDGNGEIPSDAEHVGNEQKDKDQNLNLWVV